MLPRRATICFLAFFLFSLALRADVTARYKNDLKIAAGLPEQFTQAMKVAQNFVPSSCVIRVKGTKAYTNFGKLNAMVDLSKQELTLVDVDNKRFAAVPTSQYIQQTLAMTGAKQMPSDAQKVLESVKADFSSRKTGRTETIQGIQAEESEMVLSLDLPIPGGPSSQSAFGMKMIMRVWKAKQEEIIRVPAARELAAFTMASTLFMNPAEVMKSMSGMIPGFGKAFGSMMQELTQSGTVILRTHTQLYMPFMAALAQQLAQQGKPLPPGFDPNAPFMEQTQELTELSSAPIDDSVFRLPDDYTSAPLDEIMKSLLPIPPMPARKP